MGYLSRYDREVNVKAASHCSGGRRLLLFLIRLCRCSQTWFDFTHRRCAFDMDSPICCDFIANGECLKVALLPQVFSLRSLHAVRVTDMIQLRKLKPWQTRNFRQQKLLIYNLKNVQFLHFFVLSKYQNHAPARALRRAHVYIRPYLSDDFPSRQILLPTAIQFIDIEPMNTVFVRRSDDAIYQKHFKILLEKCFVP